MQPGRQFRWCLSYCWSRRAISYPDLANALGITRQAAHKRARPALRAGFLVNLEDRRGPPARLVLSEPVPEPRPVLPEPSVVFSEKLVDGLTQDPNPLPFNRVGLSTMGLTGVEPSTTEQSVV